jgi:transcriptional regulator with XRE-family HTH domain
MAPPLSLQLGRFLKERRTALGLSTYQVAELADVPQSTIVRFELGQYAAPRPEKLSRIAGALQLPVAEVFAQMGYVNASDLPEMETYLRIKYGIEPEKINQIMNMTRRVLRSAGVEA